MKVSYIRFMLSGNFNDTIDTWIEAIQQYSFEQLCTQPGANSWSIGQVGMHLISEADWQIEQIKTCLDNNDNADSTMTPFAEIMFSNNSFPDERLTSPSNENMPQPGSKEILLQLFINLKNDVNEMVAQVANSKSKGKTKHPGLGYFNANEWLQFTDMHLRHHLKQKKRIDDFFKN